MARTCKPISGLTYGHFDAALSKLGYVREEKANYVEYSYPPEPKAQLIYGNFPLDAEVRGIDLLTTRALLDGFGVIAPKDFDLLLVQFAEGHISAIAH